MIKFDPNTVWQRQQLCRETCVKQRKPYLSGNRAEGHRSYRAGVSCESAGESAGAGFVHVRLEDRKHRAVLQMRIVCRNRASRSTFPSWPSVRAASGAADDTLHKPRQSCREACVSLSPLRQSVIFTSLHHSFYFLPWASTKPCEQF